MIIVIIELFFPQETREDNRSVAKGKKSDVNQESHRTTKECH